MKREQIDFLSGEITPMQESKLVQLKSRVSDLLKGKVPSDPVFLRFLRARDFNVDKVCLTCFVFNIYLHLHEHTKTISVYNSLCCFGFIKAREMLSQSLNWRKKHGVDKILAEYELPAIAKEYFPGKINCLTLGITL